MSKSLKQMSIELGLNSDIYKRELDFSKMELPPVPPMSIEAEMRVFDYYHELMNKEENTNG